MQKFIKTTHELQAPIDKVWNLIKSGDKWENWFDLLTGSRVEGNNRFCDIHGGDCLEELFIASNADKTFVYQVNKQQSFPATHVVGIMRLSEHGAGTTLHWSVEMEVESEEIFAALKEQIEGMYQGAAAKLQALAHPVAA